MYLTISEVDGAVAVQVSHEDFQSLEAKQKFVGGSIEAAFTIPSPSRKGYSLTGYVNEEGLIHSLPIQSLVVHPSGYQTPCAGPMVIEALTPGMDATSMTEDEARWMWHRIKSIVVTLTNGGGYRVLQQVKLP